MEESDSKLLIGGKRETYDGKEELFKKPVKRVYGCEDLIDIETKNKLLKIQE